MPDTLSSMFITMGGGVSLLKTMSEWVHKNTRTQGIPLKHCAVKMSFTSSVRDFNLVADHNVPPGVQSFDVETYE